ncbi:hypothetical protein GN956_G6376 [Arapaima gigas]
MNKLRQSFRRKKDIYIPESSRPHQWQTDEEAVRTGKCSFAVKYLGHVEVEESRGMHICEDAVKRLKMDRKSFRGIFTKAGKKAVKAVLWVSADGLRVVDDKTKDLILDQTIEKVSFCAPDRNFERAFSYICRDGTTRRWICHCFMAVKDSGERLSHAVGCAFAACLERKQKREKECGVTATFDANRTTFTREGSFRVTTATEQAEREEVMRQIQDTKRETEAKPTTPATVSPATSHPGPSSPSSPPMPPTTAMVAQDSNPHAIPRRHAPVEALARQGSFRGFPTLSQKTSPFKRQLSLRMNELPSTMQRKSDFPIRNSVPEVETEGDSISSLCTQITSAFSGQPEDPFSSAPMTKPVSPQSPAMLADWTSPTPSRAGSAAPAAPGSHKRTPSEADRWLEEVAKSVRVQQPTPTVGTPAPPAHPFPSTIPAFMPTLPPAVPIVPPRQPAYHAQAPTSFPMANGLPYPQPSVPIVGITPSQMVANVFGSATQPQAPPPPVPPQIFSNTQVPFPQCDTLTPFSSPPKASTLAPAPPLPTNNSAALNGADSGTPPSLPPPSSPPPPLPDQHQEDAFEAQWAALEGRARQHASPSPTNPFSSELHKTFEIQL